MSRLPALLLLLALATSGPALRAQQVDQPLKVLLDLDVKVHSHGSTNGGQVLLAKVFADFEDGSGSRPLIITEHPGTRFQDTTALLPVGREVAVEVETERVDYLEFVATPPPGYAIRIDSLPVPRFKKGTAGSGVFLGNFIVKMQVWPIGSEGGMDAGTTSTPQLGKFRWDLGLGYLASGRSAGTLVLRGDDLASLHDRHHLKLESAPPTGLEIWQTGAGSSLHLRRLRTDLLVDVTDLTDGFAIDFYAAGQFSPTVALSSPLHQLVTGSAFRRVEVQKNAAGDCELRVYAVAGATPTLLVKHTVSYDGEEDLWTLHSGDSATVLRTETYDYWANRTGAVSELRVGGTNARRTFRSFGNVAQQKDVTETIRNYGQTDAQAKTTYSYASSVTGWLQDVQNPDGSWSRNVHDTLGRPTSIFRPFLNSSATPGAHVSGEVVHLVYGQAAPPANDSAAAVTAAVASWSDLEYRDLPTLREVKIAGTTVAKSTFAHSKSSLNGRAVLVSQETAFASSAESFVSTTKQYSTLLHGTQAIFAGLPVSRQAADGTKTVWLHQPGAYTVGASTLTGFTPAANYDPADASKRHWRTITFHGRSAGSGSISHFGGFWPVGGDAIDPILMERDRSTIEVTVRGPQGRVLRREVYVFIGAVSGFARFPSQYARIDWTEHEYDAAAGHRLVRSRSIRTPAGEEYWDAQHAYANGRLAQTVNVLGERVSYDYDALGRVWQETTWPATGTDPLRSTVRWHNAAGDVTDTAQIPGRLTVRPASPDDLTASPRIVTRRQFDLAGRLTREEACCGRVVEFAYPAGSLDDGFVRETQRTEHLPRENDPNATDKTDLIQRRFLDGRPEWINGGTEVPRFFSYTVGSNGFLTEKVSFATSDSPRWRQVTSDWFGRVQSTATPRFGGGTLTETFEYHGPTAGGAAGKLSRHLAPGRHPLLSFYDSLGQLIREGLDANNDGQLTHASLDRIVEYDRRVVADGSDRFFEESVYGYPENGDGARYLLGRTRDRLTGFSTQTVPVFGGNGWLAAERLSYDTRLSPPPQVDGAPPEDWAPGEWAAAERSFLQTSTRQAFAARVVQDDPANLTMVTRVKEGLTRETRSFAGVTRRSEYDALGRLEKTFSREDAVTGAAVVERLEYFTDSNRVKKRFRSRTDADGAAEEVTAATFAYFANGALRSTEDPGGAMTYFTYNHRGQLRYRWGTAEDPVEFIYDAYGARVRMRQFQAGSWSGESFPASFGSAGASTTEWVHDPATGLLTERRDPLHTAQLERKVTYAYDSAHRLLTLTRARGGVITHHYSPATGELTGKSYSDPSMTALGYTYDRLGQPATVTDATGTRTWERRATDWRLERELLPAFFGTGRRLTLGYDEDLRARNRFSFGTAAQPDAFYRADWQYTDGRLANVHAYARGSSTSYRAFSYGFTPNSDLIAGVSTPLSGGGQWSQSREYFAHENRLKIFANTSGAQTLLATTFAYDNFGRITTTASTGELYTGFGAEDALHYDYTYGADGRLTAALGKVPAPGGTPTDPVFAPMPSRAFHYGYDHAGNRTSASRVGPGHPQHTRGYTPDAAQGYSAIANPTHDLFSMHVSGTPWVYEFEPPPGRWLDRPDDFHFPGQGAVAEHAFDTRKGNPPVVDFRNFWFHHPGPAGSRLWTYPPLAETPQYDRDGNLIADGSFQYFYDLENRLVAVTSNAADTLTFTYDYLGRRVEAVFWDYDFNTQTSDIRAHQRFVYDGWHLIAELDASPGVVGLPVRNTYFWGRDRSGSVGGAGTIGGLLMVDDGSGQYLVGDDGRGNVSTLADATTGALVASFEYDPYGNLLRKSGDYGKIPFRYQTKWDANHLTEDSPFIWHNWDLVDYGLRWYQPRHGRFINRDPIGEAGGLNLYEAFKGDPINLADFLGLQVYRFCYWVTISFITAADPKTDYWLNFHVEATEYCHSIGSDEGGAAIPPGGDADIPPGGGEGNAGLAPSPTEPTTPPQKKDPCDQLRSDLTAAQNSRGAYGGDPAPGWSPRGDPITDPSGFSATMFEGPNGELQLAFAGTDPTDWGDIVSSYDQAFGNIGDHYRFLDSLDAMFGSGNFSVTGHSLGGGLASVFGSATGRTTTTFNSAGIHSETMRYYNFSADDAANHVRAISVRGDILTVAQTLTPLPEAIGNRYSLDPDISFGNQIGWLRVGAFGARVAPGYSKPAGFLAGYGGARGIGLHGINEVIEAIQKKMKENGCN
jgi:RHS repeat-associated protein